MSAGAIIAIVVGVVVVIVLLALLSRAARGRRLEGRREQAAELRSDAADRGVIAKRERALADESCAPGDAGTGGVGVAVAGGGDIATCRRSSKRCAGCTFTTSRSSSICASWS